MSYESIVIEVDGPVGIVTMNRADRHNAFDEQLIAELTRGLQQLGADPSVRVVVLSSVGKSFSAGADLNWMRRAAAYGDEENLDDARKLAALMRTLDTLPKPTVARVHGPAYGGGVGLIAACDIALATFDAQFAFSEVKLGLIPAIISPYVMARIGERYARRYFLTAERFAAAEAYRIGLVHEIVPDEQTLDSAVGEIVDILLRNSPQAMAAAKQLVRAVGGAPVDALLIDDTTRRITDTRASRDAREGIAAFLEKRPAPWVIPAVPPPSEGEA
jgi:methylglutaconyl-CoA hydratase